MRPSSSRSTLLSVVICASAAAVGATVVCVAYLVSSKSAAAKSPAPSATSAADVSRTNQQPDVDNTAVYPDEIKNELFSRVRSFFGEDEYNNLQKRFVIVVGLGGVGSHAANMLVRSGVSKLRLIDFDQVTLSSLNRHAVASMEDVGISKAESMRRKLLKVVPWCKIEAITEMFKKDAADELLAGEPDFVLDCIDDVGTKAELIAHCVKKNIKILTSMGAGGKADPTRLRISALSDCTHDPLASKIKWKLKKHGVLPEQVMSVFSVEQPMAELLPLDEEQKNSPQDFGVVDYLRLRVIPVLGTSPSIFGQAMASYVLCSMAGKMYEPESCERLSKTVKHKMRQVLESGEMRRYHVAREDIDLDDDDIEFVVQQIWRTRCAATGRKIGGHAPMVLTRWEVDQPPTPYNLVLITRTLAVKFEEEGKSCFSEEVVDTINQRLLWARRVCQGAWTPSRLDDAPSGTTPSRPTVQSVCVARWLSLSLTETHLLTLLATVSAAASCCCFAVGYRTGMRCTH